MDPAQMAQGGAQPQMPPPSSVQTAPGQANVGGDMSKVMEALSMAIQQAVDGSGYVDMQKLIAMWPQVAQQLGVNVPFETVMQLVQQNPQMVSDIIVKHGLAGIVMQGRHISAEQLAGMGTGATGGKM